MMMTVMFVVVVVVRMIMSREGVSRADLDNDGDIGDNVEGNDDTMVMVIEEEDDNNDDENYKGDGIK